MDAGDKKMYAGLALFFGAAAIYMWRARCSKACPGAVDEMIKMRGAEWKYSDLVRVFSQFGSCKDCAEYARAKLPEIVESAPHKAELNISALSSMLSKHKLATLPMIEPPVVTASIPKESESSVITAAWKPSQDVVIAQAKPGWRRAKQSEITSEMMAAAIAALSKPIGSWIDKGDFAIALETHFNDTKGEHKGASIFVRQYV